MAATGAKVVQETQQSQEANDRVMQSICAEESTDDWLKNVETATCRNALVLA